MLNLCDTYMTILCYFVCAFGLPFLILSIVEDAHVTFLKQKVACKVSEKDWITKLCHLDTRISVTFFFFLKFYVFLYDLFILTSLFQGRKHNSSDNGNLMIRYNNQPSMNTSVVQSSSLKTKFSFNFY